MKKIFIVGCPRSGTTLVQKLLGGREDTYTLKETHYFERIRRKRGKRGLLSRPLDYLFLSHKNVLNAYDFIHSNNELVAQHDPKEIKTLYDATLFFDRMMTTEAKARGKTVWVEKTPSHLLSIRLITQHIPSAQFVHVIRDGRDVVASLVDAAKKFPQKWQRHTNLENTIDLYNRRLKESVKYCDYNGHIFIQHLAWRVKILI